MPYVLLSAQFLHQLIERNPPNQLTGKIVGGLSCASDALLFIESSSIALL